MICLNGGQGKEVPGHLSATLEYLVRSLAPRFPGALPQVRYRISPGRCSTCASRTAWRRSPPGTGNARGVLDGRRGRHLGRRPPGRGDRLAPWIPTGSMWRRSAGKSLECAPRVARPLAARDPRRVGHPRAVASSARLPSVLVGQLHADPRWRAPRASQPPGRPPCRSPACVHLDASRRGSARFVRRLNCAATGHLVLRRQAHVRHQPGFQRIIHQEMSIWKRCSPWRAEGGNAWWLLCRPRRTRAQRSPSSSARNRRAPRSRAGPTCGRSSSR